MTRKYVKRHFKRSQDRTYNRKEGVRTESRPVKDETDCQPLPSTIHLSRNCEIKIEEFIRIMKLKQRPFIPVKDMTPEQRMRMSFQSAAVPPTQEDINGIPMP